MPASRLPEHRRSITWLLAVPAVALAWPPLYNRDDPHLFGVPFFYAYQLLVIPVAVACALAVHRATRTRA